MRSTKNTDIREEITSAGLRYWEVAYELGIADSNFSRKLRVELSSEEKQRVRAAIARLIECKRKEGGENAS